MCDADSDDGQKKPLNSRQLIIGKCHKCKVKEPKVLIRNSEFCQACFQDSVIHRFRNNLQRLKKVPESPRVLLAVSGGKSSLMMMKLMKDFCQTGSNSKRIAKFPFVSVFHVTFDIKENELIKGSDNLLTNHIKVFAEDLNFDFHSCNLPVNYKEFNSIKSFTTKEELLEIYIKKSILNQAKALDCNVIFYANNATNLAIKTLTATAKGRGISLPFDLSLETMRSCLIVHPMRDILLKEVAIFNQFNDIHQLNHKKLTTGMPLKTSIDRITSEFVLGLDKEYPSTASTIIRTAFKIPCVLNEDYKACDICDG
jgi:cytoplasmic tRNA 2-thiolation protein 2